LRPTFENGIIHKGVFFTELFAIRFLNFALTSLFNMMLHILTETFALKLTNKKKYSKNKQHVGIFTQLIDALSKTFFK